MSTALATIESALTPLASRFAQLLPPNMSPDRIIRTVLVSLENQPYLRECNLPSILQAATTAAVLGLEVDGVSGQGYLVPFKGKVQFIAGYKGLVTIAARSGRTLEGYVVREGDGFSFNEAEGWAKHDRKLGGESSRKVIAAFAISRAVGSPDMVRVMSIDELLEIRDSSGGWKSKGAASTWGTDFEAMCRKSPMRRLANDIPNLPLQLAVGLETQHDLGRSAHIDPLSRAVVIDADPVTIPSEGRRVSAPDFTVFFDGEKHAYTDVAVYKRKLALALEKCPPEKMAEFARRNKANLEALAPQFPDLGGLLDRVVAACESQS